jgi:hypothetical protein
VIGPYVDFHISHLNLLTEVSNDNFLVIVSIWNGCPVITELLFLDPLRHVVRGDALYWFTTRHDMSMPRLRHRSIVSSVGEFVSAMQTELCGVPEEDVVRLAVTHHKSRGRSARRRITWKRILEERSVRVWSRFIRLRKTSCCEHSNERKLLYSGMWHRVTWLRSLLMFQRKLLFLFTAYLLGCDAE